MGTIADLLNTAMRDFVRFTGDGLPNEPAGRPLPVGDPASGQYNPTKKQIREAFRGLADAADGLIDPAAEAAESADQAAEDAIQTALDRAATGAGLAAANLAKAGAEAARDATALLATVSKAYSKTTLAAAIADALADLSAGATFAATGEDVNIVGFYVVETGPVARLLFPLPTAAFLSFIQFIAPEGFVWAVLNKLGQAAVGVKDDGTFAAKKAQIAAVTGVNTINGIAFSDLANPTLPSTLKGKFLSGVVHIGVYGQSLSRGFGAVPPKSTTQNYDSLRFNTGVRPDDGTGVITSFVPLIETEDSNHGETPASGLADTVKQLILAENGLAYTDHDYKLLLSADGLSGQRLSLLSDPAGVPYLRLVASMQAGFDLAQAQNDPYSFAALHFVHGNGDYQFSTAFETYVTGLEALRLQAEASANEITGRSDTVPMILSQVASHKVYGKAYPTIALAQREAARRYDDIYLAGPTYHLPFDHEDDLHLTADGERDLGVILGIAEKRVINDQIDWKPVDAIAKEAQGKIATVTFSVPSGKLVFDTTTVAEIENYGFNLFDAAGDEVTIVSVSIVGPDMVKIVAAVDILSGFKLQYGFYGTGTTGPVDGPRGNLRDTQGDTISVDSYAAHNRCIMFEEIF